jgi:hypothetical protein
MSHPDPMNHDHVGTIGALGFAFGEGTAAIVRRPAQSLAVVATIASGVGLALAISALGRAVEANVSEFLNSGPLSSGLEGETIKHTLDESRRIFTALAFVYTAALVIAVTVLSLRSLRREVGVKRQFGIHIWEVVTELLVQAVIICLAGGVAGIVLGRLLCTALTGYFSSLVVRPDWRDAVSVFGIGVALGIGSILVLGVLQAIFSGSEQGL